MVNKKRKKLFFNINTAVKKPLLALFVIIFMAVIMAFVLFGTSGKAEGFAGSGWLLMARSNYFYASPTVVLEVKYKPPLPTTSESQDTGNTVSSDDEDGELDEELDDMIISSGDNDQQQSDQQEQHSDSDAGVIPKIPNLRKNAHNALIISRLLTEKHSLRTEIDIEDVTSPDQVFIDVFSGDVLASSDDHGDGNGSVEAADTVFISFENEERVVKTVRIGLDTDQGGGIDNITVLDGISEALPVEDNTAPQDTNYSHHIDDSSLGLEQIRSPVIVIMPDTDERIYFEDGKKLKEQVFDRDYRIGEIRAVQDEIEIRLVEK